MIHRNAVYENDPAFLPAVMHMFIHQKNEIRDLNFQEFYASAMRYSESAGEQVQGAGSNVADAHTALKTAQDAVKVCQEKQQRAEEASSAACRRASELKAACSTTENDSQAAVEGMHFVC